ncbi:MAG: thioredoxin family protein [Cryomorphaceae bacterium]|nr:thioredoxin family protein [Cryomorphaceae bacterium]
MSISKDRWEEALKTCIPIEAYEAQWPEAIKAAKETELEDYIKINRRRFNRWHKRQPWKESQEWRICTPRDLDEYWIVLTEYWCGDAAHNIPPLDDFARACGVTPVYLFRDENSDIMESFLTNGKSKSIPKLIRLDKESLEVIGSWGPRPAPAQEVYEQLMLSAASLHIVLEEMQRWYNQNKGRSVISELGRITVG